MPCCVYPPRKMEVVLGHTATALYCSCPLHVLYGIQVQYSHSYTVWSSIFLRFQKEIGIQSKPRFESLQPSIKDIGRYYHLVGGTTGIKTAHIGKQIGGNLLCHKDSIFNPALGFQILNMRQGFHRQAKRDNDGNVAAHNVQELLVRGPSRLKDMRRLGGCQRP